jgi:hypothetical protein
MYKNTRPCGTPRDRTAAYRETWTGSALGRTVRRTEAAGRRGLGFVSVGSAWGFPPRRHASGRRAAAHSGAGAFVARLVAGCPNSQGIAAGVCGTSARKHAGAGQQQRTRSGTTKRVDGAYAFLRLGKAMPFHEVVHLALGNIKSRVRDPDAVTSSISGSGRGTPPQRACRWQHERSCGSIEMRPIPPSRPAQCRASALRAGQARPKASASAACT